MIVISILATYMLTHLLVEKDGPSDVFWRLRQREHFGALQCFTCASVWVAAVIAVYPAQSVLQWPLYVLGLSGGAVLINWLMERFPDE